MRYENWDTILARYVTENRDRKFRWGHFDCCLFAAGAVDAMTGSDFTHDLFGAYFDEMAAMKKILRMGCNNVFDCAKKVTKFPEVNIRAACRGDIVGHAKTAMYPLGMLGIVYGHVVMFPSDSGLKSVRLDQLPENSQALEVK